MNSTFQEFSEFAVEDFAIKFPGEEKHSICGAVGSCEETLDAKTIKKKYKGIESKTRTCGTGTGELKLSLHMNYQKYLEIYGMKDEELKDGVYAYGHDSMHPVFSVTEKVTDEDGAVKFKAYPNCTVKEGITRKVENGGEDVAEIDMTLSVMPDEHGIGMYEAIESGLDETIKTAWLENFKPELVRVSIT